MSRKTFAVMIAVITFFSFTSFALSEAEKKKVSDLYSQVELFSYVLTTVRSEYVDETDPKNLIYGALDGMLASLDPHSQFLRPEDYDELKTETQGKFGGLGIEITTRDGLLTIITPIEDTPAWKAGLKPGDKIVKIDSEITRDMTLSQAVKKMRGNPGTKVTLTILREDEMRIHEYTLTREIIHIQDVKDVHLIDNHIGYIRLTEFREDSFKEFEKALVDLKAKGADSLIIDLRNNPGGLLSVAVNVAEIFLPEGAMIVSTKGRQESQDLVNKSNNKNTDYLSWPIAVLINEGSASGSEIVAGALKDDKRGIIIGAKSFGKGSVQSVIPLPDGSGLRLTTAKYYTPSGVSIHNVGIVPDVVVERRDPPDSKKTDDKEKTDDIEKVFDEIDTKNGTEKKENALTDQEAKLLERERNDSQLQAALSVLKGIKVFKGFTQAETK
jgi:carboxyl-terminal processing protease